MAEDRTTNPSRTVVTAKKNLRSRKAKTREACMVVIYGDDLGRRIPLGSGAIVVGRSSKCDVQVDQESVSRNHARIWHSGKSYKVKDLGSTNGTYVNDEMIDDMDLRHGDQIKIGRTIFKFISANNIEAQYHEEIYRLMTVDGLTQMHNKRFFNESLEREVSRCLRYSRTFSIILFDIDQFKKINDSLGHLAGDAVLRQLGAVVLGRVRRDDIVSRIGGEEFAALLPEVSLEGATLAANKLRELVAQTKFHFENAPIKVTISLGVAQWTSKIKEPRELLKIADERLYEAKRSGRNRVCA